MFSHLIEKGKEKIELIKKRDRRYLGLGPKQTGFSEPLAHLQHPGPMLRPNPGDSPTAEWQRLPCVPDLSNLTRARHRLPELMEKAPERRGG